MEATNFGADKWSTTDPTIKGLDWRIGLSGEAAANSVSNHDMFNDALAHNEKVEYNFDFPSYDTLRENALYKLKLKIRDREGGGGGLMQTGLEDGHIDHYAHLGADSFADPNMFRDNSWYKEYDVNKYYDSLGWEWESKDSKGGHIWRNVKDTAVTGALAGSKAGWKGALVGGIVGGAVGALKGYGELDYVGKGLIRNNVGIDENERARKNGLLGNMWDGIMKGVHNANTMASRGLVDMVENAPEAISKWSVKPFFDSASADYARDFDRVNEKSYRTYHSNAYKEAFWTSPFHSEFWAEKILPAAGFMGGSVAMANGMGTVTRGLGWAGNVTRYTDKVNKAVSSGAFTNLSKDMLAKQYASALWKDQALTKLKDFGLANTLGMLSAVPEASMEASASLDENRREFIERHREIYGVEPSHEMIAEFNKLNAATATNVFSANVGINSISNVLMFGDLMGIQTPYAKGILKAGEHLFGLGVKKAGTETTKKGVKYGVYEALKPTAKQKMFRRAVVGAADPLTEGLQEMTQGGFSATHREYMMSRYDPLHAHRNLSFLDSMKEGFHDTFTSKEGIEEGLIGALMGGLGSIRVVSNSRGEKKIDILGQRGVTEEYEAQAENANALNKAELDFANAQENMLKETEAYETMLQSYMRNLSDKLGSVNTQSYYSDKAREMLENGDLAQARVAYRNALMAKVAAEKRAGLSETGRFNMTEMIKNSPLTPYMENGLRTEEDAQALRDKLADDYDKSYEMASLFYDVADHMQLAGNGVLGVDNFTELAALTMYQGANALYDSRDIAQAIASFVGDGGIADSLMYYSNLSEKQRKLMEDYDDRQTGLQILNREKYELMTNMSRALEKQAREPQNEAVVKEVEKIQKQIDALDRKIVAGEQYISDLKQRLEEMSVLPDLTNGLAGKGENVAMFFRNNPLVDSDTSATTILDNLNKLEKYVEQLRDHTYKTGEERKNDVRKAQALQDMIDSFRTQQELVRHYGKMLERLTDPSYRNNMKAFWNRRTKTEFDNEEWLENNKAGLPQISRTRMEEYRNTLKAMGVSEFDMHTYLTNYELAAVGSHISDIVDKTIVEGKESFRHTMLERSKQGKGNVSVRREQRLRAIAERQRMDAKKKYEDAISNLVGGGPSGEETTEDNRVRVVKTPISEIVVGDTIRKIGKVGKYDDVTVDSIESQGDLTTLKLSDGSNLTFDSVGIKQDLLKVTNEGEGETLTSSDVMQISKTVAEGGDKYLRQSEHYKKMMENYERFETADDVRMYKNKLYYKVDGEWFNASENKKMSEKFGKLLENKGEDVSNPNVRALKDKESAKRSAEIHYKTEATYKSGKDNEISTFVENYKSDHERVDVLLNDTSHFDEAERKEYIKGYVDHLVKDGLFKVDNLRELMEEVGDEDWAFDTNNMLEAKEEMFENIVFKNFEEQMSANKEELEELTKDDVEESYRKAEEEYARELQEIDERLEEALNPTSEENKRLSSVLDEIDEVVDTIFRELDNLSDDYLGNFDGKENIRNNIVKYKALSNIAQDKLTPEQLKRKEELLNEINRYGFVEGTVYGDNQIRLSDLLEQRAQLEEELMNPKTKVLEALKEEEREILDEPKDHELPDFKGKQATGDAGVVNNYAYGTFKVTTDGTVIVSNISGEGLVNLVADGRPYQVAYKNPKKAARIVDGQSGWENEIEPGAKVKVDFGDFDIVYELDKSKRPNIKPNVVQTITDNTDLDFSSKNNIGTSGYYTLNRLNGELIGSDLGFTTDEHAAQKMSKGDKVYFEIDMEEGYNQSLLNKHQHEDTPSQIKEDERVNAMKEEMRQLEGLYKNEKDKRKINGYKTRMTNLEKKMMEKYGGQNFYDAVFQYERMKNERKAMSEEAKRDIKDNMLIYAVDENGNRLGVVKALHNTAGNGQRKMDFLRTSLFEELFNEGDFTGRKKGSLSIDTRFVYLGIPNVEAGKTFTFSENVTDTTINPDKIKDVGYVTEQGLVTTTDIDESSVYNYAKHVVGNPAYAGRNVPVVVFDHYGKTVAYPVTLQPKMNGAKLVDKFDSLLDEVKDYDKNRAFNEIVKDMNDYLAEIGVPTDMRITSLNIEEMSEQIKEFLGDRVETMTLGEFVEGDFKENLKEGVVIDINLNDTPFIGSKVRMDIDGVSEVKSNLLTTTQESINEKNNPINSIDVSKIDNLEGIIDTEC